MHSTFLIGLWPGLTEEMLAFTGQKFERFFGVSF